MRLEVVLGGIGVIDGIKQKVINYSCIYQKL